MNAALGNVGKTVIYTDPIEANPVNQTDSLSDLVNDLNAGKVECLLILGANPVYDAPADFNFTDAIMKAKLRVHSGLYNDETGELCQWHAPAAHYLEAWSDARAYDGTVGIVQPLIAPLYEGRSAHELIALLSGDEGKSGHDLGSRLLAEPALRKGSGLRSGLGDLAARRNRCRQRPSRDLRLRVTRFCAVRRPRKSRRRRYCP